MSRCVESSSDVDKNADSNQTTNYAQNFILFTVKKLS